MNFTLPMMIARLSIGVVATLAMGFVPQHAMLWDKFPLWYHLTFLLSLVPLTYAGGHIRRRDSELASR